MSIRKHCDNPECTASTTSTNPAGWLHVDPIDLKFANEVYATGDFCSLTCISKWASWMIAMKGSK